MEGCVVIDQWQRHYNEVRLHSARGYLTPHSSFGNSPATTMMPFF